MEYIDTQRKTERGIAIKQKDYEKLYDRLESKEGEKDLYRLAEQRNRAGVRVMKDKSGNILTNEESVLKS